VRHALAHWQKYCQLGNNKIIEVSIATAPWGRESMDIIDKLQLAFQAIPEPVLLVEPSGTIMLTNPSLDGLFHYAHGELIGQPVEILVPQEVQHYHAELRDAFFQLPNGRSMGTGRDLYGLCKDGKLIPVEIGLNPVASGSDTWILASVLDITERKKQEEKIRLALDAASSAMIMSNDKGQIILTNVQVSKTFGYTQDELLYQSIEILLPERFRRRHSVLRTSYSSAPVARQMAMARELFGLHKDGREIPVEIGLTPISGHDGHFIMATIIDMTERKRSEAQIRAQNEQLMRLNEELTQFAYSASHDLKAPLATIQGLLSFALQDIDKGDLDEVITNLRRAHDLSAELAKRVEDVLGLAKADQMEGSWQRINISETLGQIKDRLAQQMSEYNVAVQVEVHGVESLYTDPTRFTQIMESLMSNGIKYASPNQGQRFVRVEAHKMSDHLQITVSDNGIGIPQNRHRDVFKMFKRFAKNNHGSGLGLALVKKHVDFFKGHIEFNSSEHGTQFIIQIPTIEGVSQC
jgi:PAS domain S-box-containing protein